MVHDQWYVSSIAQSAGKSIWAGACAWVVGRFGGECVLPLGEPRAPCGRTRGSWAGLVAPSGSVRSGDLPCENGDSSAPPKVSNATQKLVCHCEGALCPKQSPAAPLGIASHNPLATLAPHASAGVTRPVRCFSPYADRHAVWNSQSESVADLAVARSRNQQFDFLHFYNIIQLSDDCRLEYGWLYGAQKPLARSPSCAGNPRRY